MEKELHKRLRQLRKEAGLTQEQVGEHFGLSKAAISYWETENPDKRTAPKAKMMQEVADLYGTSLSILASGEAGASEPTSILTSPTGRRLENILRELDESGDLTPELEAAILAMAKAVRAMKPATKHSKLLNAAKEK